MPQAQFVWAAASGAAFPPLVTCAGAWGSGVSDSAAPFCSRNPGVGCHSLLRCLSIITSKSPSSNVFIKKQKVSHSYSPWNRVNTVYVKTHCGAGSCQVERHHLQDWGPEIVLGIKRLRVLQWLRSLTAEELGETN